MDSHGELIRRKLIKDCSEPYNRKIVEKSQQRAQGIVSDHKNEEVASSGHQIRVSSIFHTLGDVYNDKGLDISNLSLEA
jgi:hypothetical protein